MFCRNPRKTFVFTTTKLIPALFFCSLILSALLEFHLKLWSYMGIWPLALATNQTKKRRDWHLYEKWFRECPLNSSKMNRSGGSLLVVSGDLQEEMLQSLHWTWLAVTCNLSDIHAQTINWLRVCLACVKQLMLNKFAAGDQLGVGFDLTALSCVLSLLWWDTGKLQGQSQKLPHNLWASAPLPPKKKCYPVNLVTTSDQLLISPLQNGKELSFPSSSPSRRLEGWVNRSYTLDMTTFPGCETSNSQLISVLSWNSAPDSFPNPNLCWAQSMRSLISWELSFQCKQHVPVNSWSAHQLITCLITIGKQDVWTGRCLSIFVYKSYISIVPHLPQNSYKVSELGTWQSNDRSLHWLPP